MSSLTAFEQPYPGLHYYRPDQESVFAGRDKEAAACARLILKSNLTILHGLTGCGKSSFLRAGVRGRIEAALLGVQFEAEEDQGAFPVIRSTAQPLRALMTKILQVCDQLHETGTSGFGPVRTSQKAALAAMVKDEALRQEALEDADEALRVIRVFTGALNSRPILVIDQAEEVFTLVDAEAGQLKVDYDRQRAEYFTLLRELSRSDQSPHVVISLRTEYKGRFDDNVRGEQTNGPASTGFYLAELAQQGLIAAITSPTLDAPDWKGPGPSPRSRFKLTYEPGVAEALAAELVNKDKVPSGGALPTLQVACLRMWRQARHSPTPNGEILIHDRYRRRLGEISRQIEFYLEEVLEDACAKVPAWQHAAGTLVSEWHRILARNLVRRLPDGRAVSQSVAYGTLVDNAVNALSAPHLVRLGVTSKAVKTVLAELARADIGVLRQEGESWMLGHDSLALALQNWIGKNGASSSSMMNMMMNLGGAAPDQVTQEQLFMPGEEPRPTRLLVLQDYNWDRQIPIYGRKYAERLGFVIDDDDLLDVRDTAGEDKARNWPELRERISAKSAESHRALDARRFAQEDDGPEHFRVLAVADWWSFSGYGAPAAARSAEAQHWSDLLATNMTLGSGLIGQPLKGHESFTQNASDAKDLGKRLRALLKRLREDQAEFCVGNLSGRNFLQLAAWLVGESAFIDYIEQPQNLKVLEGSDYAAEDPLIAWLGAETERPRYFVGPAFAAALALQSGAEVLFSTRHVGQLASHEMELRVQRAKAQAGSTEEDGAEPKVESYKTRPRGGGVPLGKDIALDMQAIFGHTLWQVNLPAVQWRNGLNRAFILRLASVGYFTIEHIRTRMDGFIDHLNAFSNRTLADARGGARGTRLYRDIIEATVRDGFDFRRFDEYGELRYDLDAISAYWSDHGDIGAKSVAGEIYQELALLRQTTLSHFTGVAHCIAWLRGIDRYDPENPKIAEAYQLKKLAWNNFRIMNFFDAERYMARAAATLETLVQKYGY